MTYDDGRHGRFKFDDTAKKWATRFFVAIGVLTCLAFLALALGVWAIAT